MELTTGYAISFLNHAPTSKVELLFDESDEAWVYITRHDEGERGLDVSFCFALEEFQRAAEFVRRAAESAVSLGGVRA